MAHHWLNDRQFLDAGAAFVLAKRAIIDIPTILICVVTAVLIFRFKKLPEPLLSLAAGRCSHFRLWKSGRWVSKLSPA